MTQRYYLTPRGAIYSMRLESDPRGTHLDSDRILTRLLNGPNTLGELSDSLRLSKLYTGEVLSLLSRSDLVELVDDD